MWGLDVSSSCVLHCLKDVVVQGLVDVDTELLIMSEEGMLNGFCEQSEAELTSALRRAQQLRSATPKAATLTQDV